ncbi:MAG TPA: PP2C family protein-serine/threonine phosphatase [Candidatus Baltobacteraceae bacterium]|nr:PP2C family protein-serine/threonine phosphatase [Candidatus Baltobacteraceae bacterium]
MPSDATTELAPRLFGSVSTLAGDTAARILVDHLYAHRFPPVPGVDIGTAYLLADDDVRVGGDLIDVYQFNNGSVAISIADISGKGSQAASRAALVKYGLRAYVSAGFTPAQVLRNLNVLYIETSAFDHVEPDSFVSVFLGIIDPEHRIMTYASAGHEAVILLNPHQLAVLLPPTAPIVGVFEESHKLFHQRLVYLQPGGSTLIVTTDGVTEARAVNGEFIKRDDIMSWIESNHALSAQEQADSLLLATRHFCGGRAQDDIAIVVACFP